MKTSQALSNPDWAEKIKSLRLHLNKSHAAFGKVVGAAEATTVEWEQGVTNPTSSEFVILGNLAGEPTCWFFWERAGLYSSHLFRILPAVRLHLRTNEPPDLQVVSAGIKKLFSKPQLHAIPLLPLKAAAYGLEGDKVIDFEQTAAEGLIAAPSHWAPNSAFTSCLRVHGESMAPVLRNGYIIAIDTSLNDPEKLESQIVVAWNNLKGLSVCWLRTVDGQRKLMPESAEYGSADLSPASGWRVVAKVLWWIGKNSE